MAAIKYQDIRACVSYIDSNHVNYKSWGESENIFYALKCLAGQANNGFNNQDKCMCINYDNTVCFELQAMGSKYVNCGTFIQTQPDLYKTSCALCTIIASVSLIMLILSCLHLCGRYDTTFNRVAIDEHEMEVGEGGAGSDFGVHGGNKGEY